MNVSLDIGLAGRSAPITEFDYAIVSVAGLLLALGLIMVYYPRSPSPKAGALPATSLPIT